MITEKQINDASHGLDCCDYAEFAARVAEIDPVLGATVKLHAEAADGNSTPVADWPRYTLDDYHAMQAAGIDTEDAAREWWHRRYDA
jgi:hypothetical protein